MKMARGSFICTSLVLLVAMAAVILISRAVAWHDPDAVWVASECHDVFVDICVIKSDGSDYKRLKNVHYVGNWATRSNPVDAYFGPPSINNRGEIVYTCQDDGEEDTEICFINADGSGYRRLTDNALFDTSPSINNAGQVVYTCEAEKPISQNRKQNIEVCTLGLNSSETHQFTTLEAIESIPIINDQGMVLFNCADGENEYSICITDFLGEKLWQPIGIEDRVFDYAMNNLGTIVFSCNRAIFNRSLCGLHWDGRNYQVVKIPNQAGIIFSTDPSVNDKDQIVFICQDKENSDLCLLDLNSDEFSFITHSKSSEIKPKISNDGRIVFWSGEQRAISSIRSDGSHYTRLLSALVTDRFSIGR